MLTALSHPGKRSGARRLNLLGFMRLGFGCSLGGTASMRGLILSLLLAFGWPVHAEVRSEIRLSSESFLSPAYDTAGPANAQFFGAAFATLDSEDPLKVDLRGAYSSDAPLMSYMNVKEFAYITSVGEDQRFSIGRKRERWSELDRRWAFGLIEPVFRWNPLAPEGQGLTGLFWGVGEGSVRLSLFGSLFFIPEQGASFEIDSEGRFVRGNPWFRRPPDSIRIFSTTSQIEYNFDRPREADIVFQPSYGARLEILREKEWVWRASGFYKPMNQLALGYTGILDIPKDRGSVEIQPSVVYHQVLASDLIYQSRRWRAGLSAIYDKPSDENPFSSEWTRPVYHVATLGSIFLDTRISPDWIFSLQTMGIEGGEITEEGKWASEDRASITSRFPYRQASSVALEYQHRLSQRRRLQLRTSYLWSGLEKFQLVRL